MIEVRATGQSPVPTPITQPKPAQNSTPDITPPRSFGILSVAIAPDYQRMGAGCAFLRAAWLAAAHGR
ncbi:MAG: hypothetical protein H7175_27835 [Burkholderiales bacterium]|nr:hypothetical protein [Anaerolineae bacterium]